MTGSAFIIKRGLRDFNPRQLIINNEYIKFEDKNQAGETFTTLTTDEIAEYQFGMKWIQLRLTFGREYIIRVRTRDNKIVKINFKTYFGYKVKQRHKLYADILESLWNFHFVTIINTHLDNYNNNKEFSVAGVIFKGDGIVIKVASGLKQKDVFILWEKIRTKNYHTYFSIYSQDDARNINRGYSYREDWNTAVLHSVLRAILKSKNIEQYD
jgi:hypothetical protein